MNSNIDEILEYELMHRQEIPVGNKLKKFIPGVIEKLKIGKNIYGNVQISNLIGRDYYTMLPLDIKELKKIAEDTIDWKSSAIASERFNNREKAEEFYNSKIKKLNSLKKWESVIKFLINDLKSS